MEFDEKEYTLDFFKEEGYVRKKCKSCGRFFWTLNKELELCQDYPCVEYSFFDNKRNIDLDYVRNSFIDFFKKNNHKYIQPKPVLARWRDDIYLNIASIAVFQPFVTNGIVEPPANPLVISQPCIRLKDLDLVGLTAGRHLTIFEMMAHHAFNSKEKYIYWKDETLRYCNEFNTKILKLNPYEITYIESYWEGGGNAGPCFEVSSKGLELATLVFMKYKIVNGKFEDMPLFIVDTGYGLERYAWFLSGMPSAFHIIYKGIIDSLFKELGISLNEEILYLHAKYSQNETLIEKLKRDYEILNVIEGIYALLDHTKCLIFMIADGLVPSNAGEGYLGRLVIRKIFKTLKLLKIDIDLYKLLNKQINLWGKNFKNILLSKERIIEIFEIEEKKYNELYKKAELEINSLISEIKKGKREYIDINTLIELYDSKGIHPDIILKEANKHNIKVEYTKDFFSKIVEKHERKFKVKEKEEEIKIEVNLPPTIPLYYEDPYIERFNAKIIHVIEPHWIILDKTAFYPEGGGQIYDTGFIFLGDKKIRVNEVYKKGDIILHKVEYADKSMIGKEIIGEIDFERRLNIMRHHTATHILLQSIRRVLGNHIWQAGASKEEDKARLDVTHYKKVTEEDISKIEKLANEIVLSNLQVKARFMNRNEAEEKFGFYLYQGGVMDGKIIRVVSIENFDHEACGGTHVRRTGEVGLIKIIKTERIQDGVERFIFTAGKVTLEEFKKNERLINSISETLNVQKDKILQTILKLTEELKDERKENERLRELFAESISESLYKEKKKVKNINLYTYFKQNLISDDLIKIGEKILKLDKNSIALLSTYNSKVLFVIMVGEEVINKGIYANELIKIVAKEIKGGGGGDKKLAQAGGFKYEGIKTSIEKIKEYLESIL